MRPLPAAGPDTRGVTVPMNYGLMVAIVALLTAVLVAGTGAYVDDQQERTARAGLEVVGNRLAADLTTADRVAGTLDGDGSVELRTDLPERVGGTTYRVELVPVGSGPDEYRYDLVLTATDPELSVTVPVRTRRPVAASSFAGGDTVVAYDEATGALGVDRA